MADERSASGGGNAPEAAGQSVTPSAAASGQHGDVWVFAYGSLMWNPGFAFVERCEARLVGAHRTLCVYSFHHRGTPEKPGLVLGLDLGGSCRGIAYRVAAVQWPQTHAYLTEREQISGVYREVMRRVRLLDGSGRDAPAVAYLVNRAHPQYAPGLTLDDQLALVRRSHGKSGPNTDYVVATVKALESLGIRDPGLAYITQHLTASHALPPVLPDDAEGDGSP
ncbi:gamma-glutamylcyclotransferase [Xanthobacter sp. 126]|uniref:gamma-glutamylcyclotransferase n=1 Tax=Xanthobacter sp. 126 TaxID=1131814 RepID=UPI00045EA601|nr:gamma-glutamylcyclotransferase [Xanthobacter sp. 126]